MIGEERLAKWAKFRDERVSAAWRRGGFTDEDAAAAQAAGVTSPQKAMLLQRLGVKEWTAEAVAAVAALHPMFDLESGPSVKDFEPVTQQDLEASLTELRAIQVSIAGVGDAEGATRLRDDIATVTAALESVKKGLELRALADEKGWHFIEVRSPERAVSAIGR